MDRAEAQEWLAAIKADVAKANDIFSKDWDEAKHPRGDGGKFGSGSSNMLGDEDHINDAITASEKAATQVERLGQRAELGDIRGMASAASDIEIEHLDAAAALSAAGDERNADLHNVAAGAMNELQQVLNSPKSTPDAVSQFTQDALQSHQDALYETNVTYEYK